MPLIEMKERQISGASSNTDTDMQRFHAWSSTFWQFLRYCLVGGANTIIDVLMLNVLLWRFPTDNVLILVVYNSMAYSSGAVTSFSLNKYWRFGHKQRMTGREVVLWKGGILMEDPEEMVSPRLEQPPASRRRGRR